MVTYNTKQDTPILITGCARSGTSMVAGIIKGCGVFGGNLSGPTPNNKKGMFENPNIRVCVIKPYLESIGADPKGQHPLPAQEDVRFVPGLRKSILDTLTSHGKQEQQRWFYKGAKMTLVWYPFSRAFPEAKWIIVRRPKKQIIDSCMRTPFMNNLLTRKEWEQWVDYHIDRWDEMKHKLPCKELWSNKIVQGNHKELRVALSWLGLSYDKEKILAFVDPILYNISNKREVKDG